MPQNARRLLALLVLPLALVGLTVPAATAANTVGAQAPEIAITDGINGVTASTTLASYRGSPVLLVIWLPICPHCQKFMPEVHRLHQKYGSRGLKVLTVTHGRKDYTAQFMREKGWSFGVGFDWTGTTSSRFGVAGLPGVRLVGADGKLRTYSTTLDAAIEAELPQPK